MGSNPTWRANKYLQMNELNKYFDKIYCVNLDRRPDKWQESQEEFEKWGIKNVERFSAHDGKNLDSKPFKIKPSELGLILSNVDIIRNCIENGIERLLILEDDCYFTEDVTTLGNLLPQIPSDWDFFYFGGNHNAHKGVKAPERISDSVVRVHHTFSTHAVAINGRFLETMLSKIEQKTAPLDVMFTELQKIHNVYCFSPSIAFQRAGYSDIQLREMDYHRWIK